jgi:hypothetical protein
MALAQNDNLPGVKVTYEDGNLYAGNQRLGATTQAILIMGSAVDGPVGEPISVRDIGVKAAEKLFGGVVDRKTKEPHGGSLIRRMYEALMAGNDDIRLIRIDGKAAKTELAGKDVARSSEQFLDFADGNTAFALNLSVPAGGKYVGNPVVTQVDHNGIESTISNAIDYVDSTPGSEKAYFFANKLRPGFTVKVRYDYEVRNYALVPRADDSGNPDYTDPDYTLTKDTTISGRFYSSKLNWSDRLESGHIPVVYVKDVASGVVSTISSTTPAGNYIYRVGKGQVENPLTDAWSAQDYKDGGIFFTSEYHAEVSKGTYPDINGDVIVNVEYAHFASSPNNNTASGTVVGTDVVYDLNYLPQSEDFSVYFMVNNVRTDLAAGDDYSLSLVDKTVTIKSGAAPVGAQLFASYKTSDATVADPRIIVEGRFAGSVYGSLADKYDKESIRGVQVEIQEDPTDATGMEKIIIFHKPEEKKLTSKDFALTYKTKDLAKLRIKTFRQFVSHVNTDPMNNVVSLTASNEHGAVPIQGLFATDRMYLGESAPGVIAEDLTQLPDSPKRHPWLGQDGIFNTSSIEDMQALYTKLGGIYEEDATGEVRMVEQGIYSKLENYVADIIVLSDVYANTLIDPLSTEKNFASQLAQHCAIVTAKSWETIGVISMAPSMESILVEVQEYVDIATGAPVTLSNEKKAKYVNAGINIEYVNDHFMYNEANNEVVLNDDGDPIDVGRYLSVLFGPEVGLSSDKLGNYVASGSVVYGALISTLGPEVATTNKEVPAIYGLRYRLSEPQHNQLVGGRYVTFDQKMYSGGAANRLVVKDGITAASVESDYVRLSTVRIVHAAVQLVRVKADPFIGLPNGLAQRNALSSEIQAGLDRLKELGVLERFKFQIFSSAQDRVLGNAFITLELVPQFEVRQFKTSVVLKAS